MMKLDNFVGGIRNHSVPTAFNPFGSWNKVQLKLPSKNGRTSRDVEYLQAS